MGHYQTKVADPDLKDTYHFDLFGSVSEIFILSTGLDPDLNVAHFTNPFPHTSFISPPRSHLTLRPSFFIPHPSSLNPRPFPSHFISPPHIKIRNTNCLKLLKFFIF